MHWVVRVSEKLRVRGKPNIKVANAYRSGFVASLVMLALTSQSHALYTNFLNDTSNTLAVAYTSLTDNPSPTRQEQRDAASIERALKEFRKPSASVVTDYSLFVTATAHLGALAMDFLPSLTNSFAAFIGEAQAEIDLTAARIALLNDFVRTKKAASNRLAQAQAAVDSISSPPDTRRDIRAGRQVFVKIVAANKLAAIGEMRPGFAPDSILGLRLSYAIAHGPSGFVAFTNSTQYEQAEGSGHVVTTDEGTYTYDRTGLNTAQLVLHGSGLTDTVKLAYRSSTSGILTSQIVSGGGAQSRRGTFTLY